MPTSPKIVEFAVFNIGTGAPLTGAAGAMSFSTYTDETGAAITPPAIVEIGGGLYKFTPTFPSIVHGIAYMINTGANPTYLSGYIRPEDYFIDEIDLIRKLQTNKWAIITTGGDANKMVFYDDDGTTPLLKVALVDAGGTPTSTNPFARTPTT